MTNSIFILEGSQIYEPGEILGVYSSFELAIEEVRGRDRWHSIGASIWEYAPNSNTPLNEWHADRVSRMGCLELDGPEIAELLIKERLIKEKKDL